MKKLAALLMTLVILLTALAVSSGEGYDAEEDLVALTVDDHEVTQSELQDAATLALFEAALSCAGYGYGFDIIDPLNIEDEMDKLIFDIELGYVEMDQAQAMGLYPLSAEAAAAAEQEAEETWQRYLDIAWSDDGMAYLPAGNYQYVEDDPNGNIVRYFASFGLTKEALLEKAVREQAGEELKGAVTASMADQSDEDIIMYYADWILEKMDEAYIEENDMAIQAVMDRLAQDPTENQDGDGYEAFERSILIGNIYYTLGESTVRDFERNGWSWTQDADGKFAFRVNEEENYFYVRTNDNTPDGTLVMVDMFYAYDISYEYLGYGFDLAYNPDMETDINGWLETTYGGDYDDEGILRARTEVKGGTLLIEWSEGALRLTLE